MKFTLTVPATEERKGDCDACQALCCMVHRHKSSEVFPIPADKPGGVPCIHLNYEFGFKCDIYLDRSTKGFSVCCNFDCLGAGQMVTSFFIENFDFLWSTDPNLFAPADHGLITVNMRYSYNLIEFMLRVFDSHFTLLKSCNFIASFELLHITDQYFQRISQVLYSDTLSGNEFDPNIFANSYKFDVDQIVNPF